MSNTPKSRTWTVAVSTGAGFLVGAATVSGVSASWADPAAPPAEPAQVMLTEQRPVTAADPSASTVRAGDIWTPATARSADDDLWTSARDVAADQQVESFSIQTVQSAQSPVSVQSAQSPVSVQSAQSPVSVQSTQSPVSVQSAQSPVSLDSVDSPDW